MVDSVEIKTEETTSEKPVEEKQSTQSVQGLPEKFKSVEDLAKSYSELEKKLGEQTPKEETVDPVSATKLKEEAPKQENSLEIAEDAVENAGLNFDTLAQEYAEKGQLGDESYKALEQSGIPKAYVDQFIAGQKAIGEQQTTNVKTMVGGEEAYNEMASWASKNMSEGEKKAYNAAVNSADMDTVKLAVDGLRAKYQAANGTEPSLMQGKATPVAEQGFESWAEVTAAMADPRYSKDPAYQEAVKQKLANSEL
jgi:NADH dehydrogenase/NADH:ubiquinone oxidoreductase subunit G